MRILVTGSSGTIGTRLCERLLESGHEVIGVDWEPNQWQESVQAITQIADLRDLDACMNLPSDIDAVVHLAANARVYDLVVKPEDARDNMISTFNVLEYARKHQVPKFIFASSRECYGNQEGIEQYREEMTQVDACESPYTASKVAGEALVHAYQQCYGLDFVIFRFSNVYGMYDESNRVVPLFIREMRDGNPVKIFGRDKCLDFTYIDDTVDGIVSALTNFDTAKNETYNLAYGKGIHITYLAERLKELLESSSEITMDDVRTGEVVKYVADISKARDRLEYDPKTPFDDGIQKSVEWYLNEETNLR